ncbi:MAG: sigma-70 family RNA polymerase sigma factor [Solirubrobacteraceae bacterium]
MDEREWVSERFEHHRSHLRAVAYRMLGSVSEADDALQEAWLRICDQDHTSVENMQAWLTTIVGRVCLNMLRSRRSRPEELAGHVPDPVVSLDESADPEQEALLADSVGLAMLVVLDALTPAERLAFVMHDVFAVPFADVAAVLDRSEAAVQQLASRARRRVRGAPEPDPDLARQRQIVDAFFAASRDGDFDALVALLDPDVELRIDGGVLREQASLVLRGAPAVAGHTTTYAKLHPFVKPAFVNGAAGAVVAPHGRLFSVMAFTVTNGRITQIDALLDPERLAQLELSIPPTAATRS